MQSLSLRQRCVADGPKEMRGKVKIAACNIFELILTARSSVCSLIPVTARILICTKVVTFHHASYVRRNLVKPARVQLLIEFKASYASHVA